MNILSQYSFTILLVVFILYRKVKRTIGFQEYRPRKIIFRIVIFSFLSIVFFSLNFIHPITFIYTAIGLLSGLVLLHFAIRHSKFEIRKTLFFYRTNIWIESIILILFFSRFFFRFIVLIQLSQTSSMDNLMYGQHFTKDPFTVIVLFILFVYYIGFNLFVLKKGKHNNPLKKESKTITL